MRCVGISHFFIQSTKTAFFRDGRASAADLAGTPDAFCTSSAFYFLHGQGIVLLLKIWSAEGKTMREKLKEKIKTEKKNIFLILF